MSVRNDTYAQKRLLEPMTSLECIVYAQRYARYYTLNAEGNLEKQYAPFSCRIKGSRSGAAPREVTVINVQMGKDATEEAILIYRDRLTYYRALYEKDLRNGVSALVQKMSETLAKLDCDSLERVALPLAECAEYIFQTSREI